MHIFMETYVSFACVSKCPSTPNFPFLTDPYHLSLIPLSIWGDTCAVQVHVFNPPAHGYCSLILTMIG